MELDQIIGSKKVSINISVRIKYAKQSGRKRSECIYFLLFSNYGNHFPLLIVSLSGSLSAGSHQRQENLDSISNEIESF